MNSLYYPHTKLGMVDVKKFMSLEGKKGSERVDISYWNIVLHS